MRVAFATLGCKVNQVDTAHLEAAFSAAGYQVVPWPGPADVVVVNTCTVTALADRQSRQMVKRGRRANPDALVIVTGCAPLSGGGMVDAFAEADLVTGNVEKDELVSLVRDSRRGITERLLGDVTCQTGVSASNAALINGHVRAFLKVQDGCPANCTYCVVPRVRGRSRSVPPGDVVRAVDDLVRMGQGEVVLTGIHLGVYGADLEPPTDLARLCRAILAQTPVARLRLSSLEPREVSSELIDLLANEPRFCNHLHIPLQSGSDRILEAMNRPYRVADYEATVAACRARVPDITIGADVLVGFPGETEDAFAETMATLARLRLPHVHVFPYSDRPGTVASKMPNKVPRSLARERAAQVRAVAAEHQRAFRSGFVGRRLNVLVEDFLPGGTRRGMSRNYLPVIWTGKTPVGCEEQVFVQEINEKGELLG